MSCRTLFLEATRRKLRPEMMRKNGENLRGQLQTYLFYFIIESVRNPERFRGTETRGKTRMPDAAPGRAFFSEIKS